MMRIITAMFDSRNQAEAAVQRLTHELNLDRDLIQVYAADTTSTTATTSSTQDTGLWASIKDLFVPDEDRYAYAEGMRRGGTVVSVQVEEDRLDDAMSILESDGAVDLDSREAEWRQSGWTGYQADAVTNTTVASSPSTAGLGVAAAGAAATAGMTAHTGLENRTATAASTTHVGGEQVIPIVEEQVRVGKRDVERGRVRVRSYVVETPVSEQVTLREEHVEVQRRAVDRPLGAVDDAFREQVIEATESREEAVVAKEARVVEEVTIRKDAAEHIETVQDTVRRTEVEIDDTTGTAQPASNVGSTGSGSSNPPGTAASRAVDETLGTNISGANPARKA
jgi:uncharacterized protein (TIGR02271 family)